MKMRNPAKHHCARLKHAKGQIFTCGMFGTCSDSVLSPRTPPPLVISNPIPTNAAAATTKQQQQQQQQQQQPVVRADVVVAQEKTISQWEFLKQQQPCLDDVVAQEKMISQWDFRLKQQQQQQQEPDHFKERYNGLVDRDLSPIQFSHGGRSVVPLAKEADFAAQLDNVDALCEEAAAGRVSKASLRSLRRLAEESDKNKSCMINAGVPESLISLLVSNNMGEPEMREAFAVVSALVDDERTQKLISQSNMLPLVEKELKRRSTDAWILLSKVSTNDEVINSASTGIFDACVTILKDPSAEAKLVRLALKAMLGICLSKQNRVAAVNAGAVEALLETLIDLHGVDGGDFCNRSGIVVNVERALATLELLCTTAEGRTAMCNQPSFISELVGLVLGVSERATEYAAGVLCSVLCDNLAAGGGGGGGGGGGVDAMSQLSENGGDSVQEIAVKGGAPAQMLLVMQSDCSERARRKAAKLLKALHKYGEDHSTIHSDLASTITY